MFSLNIKGNTNTNTNTDANLYTNTNTDTNTNTNTNTNTKGVQVCKGLYIREGHRQRVIRYEY